ncbi:MAG: ParB/RepB/Spo0J family partition protein [Clostridia bacterium]|nr:ParB/RepB/Spo0J family partition protein [Clostridia bacterium]
MENIKEVELSKLLPFPDHPFRVLEDESMREMAESIREYGVLMPLVVRPVEEGQYEIISGHRRKYACEIIGMETVPVIVRELDRDASIIMMVDSNLQRENILPSERAAAYKMKLEAIKRQGQRSDLTCGQVDHKLNESKSRDKIAEETGESGRQVQRYIRLTELSPELQQMVDEKKIAMTPAVEISYLKPEEQKLLVETIESEQATPSLSQAKRMKQMSREGTLTDDTMLSVMSEQKKPEKNEIVLPYDALAKFFPKNYTPHQMERMIYKLLENWQKKKQRQHGER